MPTLCLLALLVGAVLSVWTPVFQFGAGLVLLCVVGLGVGLSRGLPFWFCLTASLIAFAVTQIGYVLGLGFMAWLHHMRSQRDPEGKVVGKLAPPTHTFPK